MPEDIWDDDMFLLAGAEGEVDGEEEAEEDVYYARPRLTAEEAAADMRKWNMIFSLIGLSIVGCLIVAFCAWVVAMCGGCLG